MVFWFIHQPYQFQTVSLNHGENNRFRGINLTFDGVFFTLKKMWIAQPPIKTKVKIKCQFKSVVY